MGEFAPSAEYVALDIDNMEHMGTPPHGGKMKSFPESRNASAATPKLIYGFTNLHTIDECRRMIDDYA